MKQIESATDHTCVDCSDVYTITDSEYRWYLERGFTTPKRCKFCREAKRQRYASRG